jgi:hypothetical protein
MNWYKTLNIQTRINLKEITPLIIGVEFHAIVGLLGIRQTIELLEGKLKMEGIIQ